MQAAIRKITNKIIYQKSSHVSEQYLKFDVGIIGDRLSSAEIAQIEELIRQGKFVNSIRKFISKFLKFHQISSNFIK